MHSDQARRPAPGAVNDAAPFVGAESKKRLTLGFVPLTDCAPLVIAQEHGLFAAEGLDVTLSREASWANIRDKVAAGLLDGAQMLASMPIATTLGLGEVRQDTVTALSLDLNGNAITVSNALFREIAEHDPEASTERVPTAGGLKALLDARRAAGLRPPVFAMVFPFSTHNYLLRYWLAAGGVDPDRDLRLVVIPPPQMVAALRLGAIDGFCVGEPWNAVAVAEDLGRVLVTSHDIWNNHPEKVFGVNAEWAERHPAAHAAILRALIRAGQWLDEPANRHEASEVLAHPDYVGAPAEIIAMSMAGSYRYAAGLDPCPMQDFNVFSRYAANFPWRSHAVWLLTQMVRWGQVREPLSPHAVAERVYRPEFFRAVAAEIGLPCPSGDAKPEGLHAGTWLCDDLPMGPDRFVDGRRFDPADPAGYLRGFDLHQRRIEPEQLA